VTVLTARLHFFEGLGHILEIFITPYIFVETGQNELMLKLATENLINPKSHEIEVKQIW